MIRSPKENIRSVKVEETRTKTTTHLSNITFESVERVDVDAVVVLQVEYDVLDIGCFKLHKKIVELIDTRTPQLDLVRSVAVRFRLGELRFLFEQVFYLLLPVDYCGL